MWWLAVLAPLVVLAIVIAVAPVAFGTVRFHRWHTREVPRRPASRGQRLATSRRRLRCPLCAARLEGATTNEVIAARNEHFLRTHVSSETPSTEMEQARSI